MWPRMLREQISWGGICQYLYSYFSDLNGTLMFLHFSFRPLSKTKPVQNCCHGVFKQLHIKWLSYRLCCCCFLKWAECSYKAQIILFQYCNMPPLVLQTCFAFSQDGRVFIWTCDDASGNSWSPKLLHKFNDVVWHVSWSITANILAVSGGDNKVSAVAWTLHVALLSRANWWSTMLT